MVKNQRGLQLNGLVVGGFLNFLIRELDTKLVNIKADVSPVLNGEIKEEILANSIDIVQAHLHTMLT